MFKANEEDGIEALPDEILHYILSYLPADEAMMTCILSRYWRNLWKSTSVLSIIDTQRWKSSKEFNRFFNHLVQFRGISPLRKFVLECNSCREEYETDEDGSPFRYVMMWVMYALMCQIRVLRISNFMQAYIEMDDGMPLVSRHLTKLDLSGLELRECFLNFLSFPALKWLYFSDHFCFDSVKKIVSQSIEYLCFYFCQFSEHRHTHIYAPSPVGLHLEGFWGQDTFSVKHAIISCSNCYTSPGL